MNPRRLISVAQNHMATTFEFTVSVEASLEKLAHTVLLESLALVGKLESELSEFRCESPIYRLNHARIFEEVDVSDSALELIEISESLCEDTGGAFNPRIKGKEFSKDSLGISYVGKKIWKKKEGVWLSFGAIGKGYALDKVRERLVQSGLQDFLLSAGGSSIVISGFMSDEIPWSFGWSWKKDYKGDDLGLEFHHRSGANMALGISGLHEKGLHLIDPKTGKPTDKILSSLIGHPSAAYADALSTAFFVSGWEKSQAQFQNLLSPPAMALIDEKETCIWNKVFEKLWQSPYVGMALGFLFTVRANAEDAVNLEEMGFSDFTPYLIERNSLWVLLPIFMIFVVLIHLIGEKKGNSHDDSDLYLSAPQQENTDSTDFNIR